MNRADGRTSRGAFAGIVGGVAVAVGILVSGAFSAAGASPGLDRAESASAAAKPGKKLRQRVKALEQRLDALALQPGPPGAQGPAGQPGAAGAAGATNVTVRTANNNIGGGITSSIFGVACNAGERATGGGVGFASPNPGDFVAASLPGAAGITIANNGDVSTGWIGSIHNGAGGPRTATVYAICARP